jgi:hypothetical protein
MRHTFLLGLIGLAQGCSAAGDATEDPDPQQRETIESQLSAMTFLDECETTRHSDCLDCKRAQSQRAGQCDNLCRDVVFAGGSPSCLSTCSNIRSSNHCDFRCDGDPDECTSRKYTFEITRAQDSELLTSCEAAVERDDECGERVTGDECEQFALVEGPQAVSFYACLADAECGVDVEHCTEGLPEDQFAASVQGLCPDETLLRSTAQLLDALGPWLHPDVRADVEICVQDACGTLDFRECVESWLDAVYPL